MLALNRLATAIESGSEAWSQDYCYDTWANRWLQSSSSTLPASGVETPTSNIYNPNNRINMWTYDAAGNILSILGSGAKFHL